MMKSCMVWKGIKAQGFGILQKNQRRSPCLSESSLGGMISFAVACERDWYTLQGFDYFDWYYMAPNPSLFSCRFCTGRSWQLPQPTVHHSKTSIQQNKRHQKPGWHLDINIRVPSWCRTPGRSSFCSSVLLWSDGCLNQSHWLVVLQGNLSRAVGVNGIMELVGQILVKPGLRTQRWHCWARTQGPWSCSPS